MQYYGNAKLLSVKIENLSSENECLLTRNISRKQKSIYILVNKRKNNVLKKNIFFSHHRYLVM